MSLTSCLQNQTAFFFLSCAIVIFDVTKVQTVNRSSIQRGGHCHHDQSQSTAHAWKSIWWCDIGKFSRIFELSRQQRLHLHGLEFANVLNGPAWVLHQWASLHTSLPRRAKLWKFKSGVPGQVIPETIISASATPGLSVVIDNDAGRLRWWKLIMGTHCTQPCGERGVCKKFCSFQRSRLLSTFSGASADDVWRTRNTRSVISGRRQMVLKSS